MTMLITEIHCINSLLSNGFIVFAADRRISRSGNYEGSRKKIFPIPYLRAGIGFFGLAEVFITPTTSLPMSDWLSSFIRNNSSLGTLSLFANKLAEQLNTAIPAQSRQKYISGFHIAGYTAGGMPEFWFVRNVEDDRKSITGVYAAREDFLSRDARVMGYDGVNASSIRTSFRQTYRNGDIRAHVTVWEKIDEGFSALARAAGIQETQDDF